METEGINARRFVGAAVEPMGEFVQLIFETDDGTEFIVRLHAEELRVRLPDLLTLPGRANAIADPIGSPTPPPAGRASARVLPAAAAVIRTDTGNDQAIFELHIGLPPYPVFFSFPRDRMREVVEEASRRLAKSERKP